VSEVRFTDREWEIPFPPESTWAALAGEDLVQAWLTGGPWSPDADPLHAAGAVDAADAGSRWEVFAVEPNRSLSYVRIDAADPEIGPESVVTFTLTPAGAGTRLRIEHTRLGLGPDQADGDGGWESLLDSLRGRLGQGPGPAPAA
jgi:uncharacterized protein YndB with AHSA1/START domain